MRLSYWLCCAGGDYYCVELSQRGLSGCPVPYQPPGYPSPTVSATGSTDSSISSRVNPNNPPNWWQLPRKATPALCNVHTHHVTTRSVGTSTVRSIETRIFESSNLRIFSLASRETQLVFMLLLHSQVQQRTTVE